MGRLAQAVVTTFCGTVLLGIAISGRYTSYVRPGLGPVLLVGAAILTLVGTWALVQVAAGSTGHDDGHHHHGGRAAWLILIPPLLLIGATPAALGSDYVQHEAGSANAVGAVVPVTTTRTIRPYPDAVTTAAAAAPGQHPFPALPTGTAPEIGIREFAVRAVEDSLGSVVHSPVTVVGFVAPAGAGYSTGYSIARIYIVCCAADAVPMRLHVTGTAPYPSDTWVRAVVTARPGASADTYLPTVDVHSLTVIAAPADPYGS